MNQIATMAMAFAGSDVARGAVMFATSLVVARRLGANEFGQWTLCLALIAALTMVFDLGFGRLVTRAAAGGEPGVGRLVGSALVVRLGLFAPVGLLLYVAVPVLGGFAPSAPGLRLALAASALSIAYGCIAAVFRASARPLLISLAIEMTAAIVQFAATWIVINRGGGAAHLLVLVASLQALQLILLLACWPRVAGPGHRIEVPAFGGVARAATQALPFALSGLIANGQVRLAPLMLGVLSGADAVAAFGVAGRISNLVRVLPHAAFAGAMSVLSTEVRRGQSAPLRVRFEGTLGWFALAAGVVLAALAAPLVRFSYGPAFAAAVPVLVWMAVGLVPYLLNSGRKVCLYAAGYEHVAVRWSAVAFAIQAVGCAALIPGFGAPGAAFALALGEAVVWMPLRRVNADTASDRLTTSAWRDEYVA